MHRTQRFALFLLFLFSAQAFAQEPVKTWGAVLNPGGQAPLNAFQAFYINTENPRQVVASEVVPRISINYPYDEFHGIPSQDFGAYWVGRLRFARDETRNIEWNLSWSKARLVIDGKLVHEGSDSNLRKPFLFTRGEHLVEVEYINNWHTTSFRVNFSDQTAPLTRPQLLDRLSSLGLKNPDVHYVGVYESSAQDLSIQLHVARSSEPVILVLSTYDPVNWVVHEEKAGTVRAVIYGGSNLGSEVTGVDTRKVLVLPYARVGSYELKPRCTCTGTDYYCENSGSVLNTTSAVEELTGWKVVSFTAAYSAKEASIPGTLLTAEFKQGVQVAVEDAARGAAQCRKRSNPDFDTLLEEQKK